MRQGEYRALLDALLLKARHELGLPLDHVGLARQPSRTGTHASTKKNTSPRSGWSARAISRPATSRPPGPTIARSPKPSRWRSAIRDYRPIENDERLGAIIEVAFNHGVSPERGFELILEHYGTCPAITAFEQLPPHEEATRAACAGRLIRHLHRELTRTSAPRSPAGARCSRRREVPSPLLLEDRPWLFADEALPHRHLAPGGRGADVASGARPRRDGAGRRPDRVRPAPLAALGLRRTSAVREDLRGSRDLSESTPGPGRRARRSPTSGRN